MDCRICRESSSDRRDSCGAAKRGGIHVAPSPSRWLVQPEISYLIFLARGHENGQPRLGDSFGILSPCLSGSSPRSVVTHSMFSSAICNTIVQIRYFRRGRKLCEAVYDTIPESPIVERAATRGESGSHPKQAQHDYADCDSHNAIPPYHSCRCAPPCTASEVLCHSTLSPLATCVNAVQSRRVADG